MDDADVEELFGTAGIRGEVRSRVTPAFALRVAAAAARDGGEFVVGRDGRESGPALAAAVEAGLTSAGARVVRVGQVPTPALAFASRGRRGVMVTASHNPPSDNGLKFFRDGREYDGASGPVDLGSDAGGRWGRSWEGAAIDISGADQRAGFRSGTQKLWIISYHISIQLCGL